ncbi:MAG: formate dehydrogenase accessory sulfurtransferase FdhD, partial [Armatimonadetes bacterium]|nr:formate dehydrogenase accessory sulfurtransferase FdhD [Armatimonadota bacterium]
TVGDFPGSYQPLESVKSLDCLQVTKLMLEMSRASEAYRQHGGIHTSALSEGETLLVVAEDVGKLNTLDKIMGECLKRGIEPDGKILLSSGRITSKMLLKAARMRIPILLSRSSPTSLAVEWADRLGLTLVGYARGNSCRVYTHEYRITTGG